MSVLGLENNVKLQHFPFKGSFVLIYMKPDYIFDIQAAERPLLAPPGMLTQGNHWPVMLLHFY